MYVDSMAVETAEAAIQALEKQIPKKVSYEWYESEYMEGTTNYGKCPVCDVTLIQGDKYCKSCGNALKWRRWNE